MLNPCDEVNKLLNYWNKFYIPSLPQEQAAKTNMASVVRIQVFSFMHS